MINRAKAILKSTLLLCVIAMLPSLAAYSQNGSDSIKATFNIYERLNEPTNGSSITIEQDPQVKNLLRQHFDKGGQGKIKGWRIRIFRDNTQGQSGRTRAEALESSFRQNNPGVPVYRTYEAPYWYISIGDFRTRDEAEKMKKELKGVYLGASIIEMLINFPPL